jgi:ribosomal protein S9
MGEIAAGPAAKLDILDLDHRVTGRKKYGKHKACRSTQFSKR